MASTFREGHEGRLAGGSYGGAGLRASAGYGTCPVHFKIGFLAAAASSNRLRLVLAGASLRSVGSVSASLAMAFMTSTKRSSSPRASLSVGSTMSAPWTTSGKYTVGGWKP